MGTDKSKREKQIRLFSPTGVLLLGTLLTSIACVFFGFHDYLEAEKHGMGIKIAAKKLTIQEWREVAQDLRQRLLNGNLNQTPPSSEASP